MPSSLPLIPFLTCLLMVVPMIIPTANPTTFLCSRAHSITSVQGGATSREKRTEHLLFTKVFQIIWTFTICLATTTTVTGPWSRLTLPRTTAISLHSLRPNSGVATCCLFRRNVMKLESQEMALTSTSSAEMIPTASTMTAIVGCVSQIK